MVQQASAVSEAGDTLHAHGLHTASPAGGVAAGKVCCVCGKDVNGRKRFKDAQGRYWCVACNDAGLHPIPEAAKVGAHACGDCGKVLSAGELQDYHGQKLCEGCKVKHQLRAKREEGRMAALAREEKTKSAHRKQIIIALAVALVVLLVVAVKMFF